MTINSAVPDHLIEIITKLHAKDPADRYQSATEVVRELEGCLAQVACGACPT